MYHEELRNDENEIFITVFIDGEYYYDYMVSNQGRIFSLKSNCFMEGRCNNGYNQIKLRKDGKNHYKFVHRIVAESFCKNDENKPHVNHIDGNKYNNHPSNLEWVTAKENIHHAMDTGLMYTKGEKVHFASIDEAMAHKICQLIDEGKMNLKEIALYLNVGKHCVYKIHSGKSWKHVSNQYNFLK